MSLSTQDRLEITELMSRLCHALDFSRPEDFAGVFVPAGVYRAVSSVVTGEQERFRHEGAEALRAFAAQAVERRKGLGRHWTGNVVLGEADDDGATALSLVLFVEIDPQTKERRIPISGVHRDRFIRTADGWRFTERTVIADI